MHHDSLSFLPYVGFIIFAVFYGLDEDNLRAFGLFNELDSNTEGAGVGLAIVMHIIEICEGRIWIKSNAFFFTLPVKGGISS
jgi:signal transduction histidine kinase